MKYSTKTLLLLFMLAAVWTNCGGDDATNPNNNNNNNNNGGTGANSISMTLNGASWSNTTSGGAVYSDSSGFFILVIGGSNGDQVLSLSIISFTGDITTGNYTPANGFLGGFIDTSAVIFAVGDTSVGTSQLQLSKFDRTNQRVSGTFEMNLKDAINGGTITIINGKFTDVPLTEN